MLNAVADRILFQMCEELQAAANAATGVRRERLLAQRDALDEARRRLREDVVDATRHPARA